MSIPRERTAATIQPRDKVAGRSPEGRRRSEGRVSSAARSRRQSGSARQSRSLRVCAAIVRLIDPNHVLGLTLTQPYATQRRPRYPQ